MKRLRGKKVTPDNIPAPFRMNKTGPPDIDSMAAVIQKKNEKYSEENPFILDVEGDPFSPPTPTFFQDDNEDLENRRIPRPCIVPKPKPSYEHLPQ